MRAQRFLPSVYLSCLLGMMAVWLNPSLAKAQGSAVLPRIVSEVDNTHLTKLSGGVPLMARAGTDFGEVSPEIQLTHMRLVLSRSSEQEAALEQYLFELQDKSSPNYHKWLTPEQFGKLYGPADSDIAALVAWLESRGLKLEQVSPGRTNIAFSGTVSQAEAAFHTSIHSFQANFGGVTSRFYANTVDPSIPAALAPVVRGVAHLDTIRPIASKIAGPQAKFDPATKRMKRVADAETGSPRPNLTINEGSTTDPSYFLFMVPGDAATIYDTPNTTFNANYTSGTSYTGSGVTIGIGGDAVIQTSTVVNYRSLFLGNSTAPTVTNVDGVTSTDNTDEAYVDTQLSGGLAPGAAIHFYTSSDLYSAIEQAISDNTVDIFSLSFGFCELGFTTADNQQFESWWQQAAGQGIAVTVSTGDNGSAGCDAGDATGTTEALYGEGVNGLGSTPYNIAVGGTDMAGLNSSFSTYANTSEGSSTTYFRTALSYIPESTWNDSTETDTTISANVPWSTVSGNANIVAGGGGASSCSTNTDTDNTTGNCTSGYAKPVWQRGTGVPADKVRDLPDVSLMAGNGFDPATWLICTDDTFTSGGTTYSDNCAVDSSGDFNAAGFGGTSTAAPAFAGILALVEQKSGSRLGQAAVELYDLYNGSNSSAIFHDTTVGNNSVPCESGTLNCVANTGGYYYESGYNTTAGYDLATGLGSVDAKELVSYWGSAVGATTPTVTVTPSASSITNAGSLTVTVMVAGVSTIGTPTGTVTLAGGGYTSSAEKLSSGGYSFTIAAGALSVGTDTLKATYSGDVNYAAATGTSSVTVTEVGSYSLSAAAATIATPGSSGSSTVTATATGGYTGTITLTCSVAEISGGIDTPTCSGSTITVASGATTATGTISLGTTAASTSFRPAKLKADSSGTAPKPWAGFGGASLACVLLMAIPARRRVWRSLVGVVAFAIVIGALSGCGSGGSSTKTVPGTTAGSYTVTVTGTDTNGVSETTTFTLTVQ